jgi:hypothetical protein
MSLGAGSGRELALKREDTGTFELDLVRERHFRSPADWPRWDQRGFCFLSVPPAVDVVVLR